MCQLHSIIFDPETGTCFRLLDFLGFPGYRVGDDGSIWSCLKRSSTRQMIPGNNWKRKKPTPGKHGHLYVNLRSKMLLVHRLVLESFVGPCPEGMEACHFPDPNPSNNHLSNLRWDTHASNSRDMVSHGNSLKGIKNPNVKITEDNVRSIRNSSESQTILAKRYGVHQTTIHYIKKHRWWKHVN